MKWECELGHRWEARLDHVMGKKTIADGVAGAAASCRRARGTWCPTCNGKKNSRRTLEDCKTLAVERFEGLCLAEEYKNNNQPLKWKCSSGHVFSQCFRLVQAKRWQWCPTCSQRRRELKLEKPDYETILSSEVIKQQADTSDIVARRRFMPMTKAHKKFYKITRTPLEDLFTDPL